MTTSQGRTGWRRWLRWGRNLFALVGALSIVAGLAWSWKDREWVAPRIESSLEAPGGEHHALIVRRTFGLWPIACARRFVLPTRTPELPPGDRRAYAYWERAVFSAGCDRAIDVRWTSSRSLELTVDIPRTDERTTLEWQRRGGDRNELEVAWMVRAP